MGLEFVTSADGNGWHFITGVDSFDLWLCLNKKESKIMDQNLNQTPFPWIIVIIPFDI